MPAPPRSHSLDILGQGLSFTLCVLAAAWATSACGRDVDGDSLSFQEGRRLTPVVRAVRGVAPSVVNIQGQKAVSSETPTGGSRQVNGMGTGVVIDARGYILTNFHVVDGVRPINVTLSEGQKYVAQIVSHDRETDLAVIRIVPAHAIPTVQFGTSSDLMAGETVVAVGNAFGYENTVTTGIISALHRNVQVNESQQYLDLIQTDASINPGNSGGPLLNIDGQMIGVNVAVRAGAQGIGFAIPIDKALDVAASMMSIERIDRHWHGMRPLKTGGARRGVTIAKVEAGSPARQCGLQSGDELEQIGPTSIERAVDVEFALLGRPKGEKVPVTVRRDGKTLRIDMALAALPQSEAAPETPRSSLVVWESLGLELTPEPTTTFKARNLSYTGGMRVVRVRAGSSAAQQGVLAGDLLVRVHRWSTTSEKDLRYISDWAVNNAKLGSVPFYIVRGSEEFYGQLALQSDVPQRR